MIGPLFVFAKQTTSTEPLYQMWQSTVKPGCNFIDNIYFTSQYNLYNHIHQCLLFWPSDPLSNTIIPGVQKYKSKPYIPSTKILPMTEDLLKTYMYYFKTKSEKLS